MRGSRGGVGRGGGPDLPRTINISSIYIVELAKIYVGPPPPARINITRTPHWKTILDPCMHIILVFRKNTGIN